MRSGYASHAHPKNFEPLICEGFSQESTVWNCSKQNLTPLKYIYLLRIILVRTAQPYYHIHSGHLGVCRRSG